MTKAVSWTVANTGRDTHFEYYACWVSRLGLWFLTGPNDYYLVREGITTAELIDILNREDVVHVFIGTTFNAATKY